MTQRIINQKAVLLTLSLLTMTTASCGRPIERAESDGTPHMSLVEPASGAPKTTTDSADSSPKAVPQPPVTESVQTAPAPAPAVPVCGDDLAQDLTRFVGDQSSVNPASLVNGGEGTYRLTSLEVYHETVLASSQHAGFKARLVVNDGGQQATPTAQILCSNLEDLPFAGIRARVALPYSFTQKDGHISKNLLGELTLYGRFAEVPNELETLKITSREGPKNFSDILSSTNDELVVKAYPVNSTLVYLEVVLESIVRGKFWFRQHVIAAYSLD